MLMDWGIHGRGFCQGIIYDDYITSKFYRLVNNEGADLKNSILEYFGLQFFISNELEEIIEVINHQKWMTEGKNS